MYGGAARANGRRWGKGRKSQVGAQGAQVEGIRRSSMPGPGKGDGVARGSGINRGPVQDCTLNQYGVVARRAEGRSQTRRYGLRGVLVLVLQGSQAPKVGSYVAG